MSSTSAFQRLVRLSSPDLLFYSYTVVQSVQYVLSRASWLCTNCSLSWRCIAGMTSMYQHAWLVG
jgi:hypothetical protein